jgi:hypothetical protein|tara:strand:+ start:265 stop:435 length:171 start_codon:yes stop_codon:yes gene_type:complete
MRRETRRRFSAEEKIGIVLEGCCAKPASEGRLKAVTARQGWQVSLCYTESCLGVRV